MTLRSSITKRAALASVVLVSGTSLAGCTSAAHTASAKTQIDTFNARFSKSNSEPYSITYRLSGGGGGTVQLAASPPDDVSFVTRGGSGGGGRDIVTNSNASYECDRNAGSQAQWLCLKYPGADGNNDASDYASYQANYWISILDFDALASGVTVATSTMTVHGYKLECLTVAGTSSSAGNTVICTTAQGVLAYVNEATNAGQKFALTNYSTTTSASDFQLPGGAVCQEASNLHRC